MARIALDVTPLQSGHRYRGIGQYTKQLLDALRQWEPGHQYKEFTQGQKLPDCDLVHYPYFDLFFQTLPLVKAKPTIVTIHDIIPLLYPEQYPPGIRGMIKFWIQRFSLTGVSAVITDSVASKNDIAKYLRVPADKIYPIHLAPSANFRAIDDQIYLRTVARKYNLPDQFLLYVGDVSYHKNLSRLLEVVKVVELPLVMVGKSMTDASLPQTQALLAKMSKLDLEQSVKRLPFLPEDDLVAVYNLATVTVLPSLAEGFGLSILEAMACGCPVVTSNRSSMAEIAGDAAILVDPENVDSIAQGIKAVTRGNQAKEWVKHFTWEKTAQETAKVYEKVAREV